MKQRRSQRHRNQKLRSYRKKRKNLRRKAIIPARFINAAGSGRSLWCLLLLEIYKRKKYFFDYEEDEDDDEEEDTIREDDEELEEYEMEGEVGDEESEE